MGGDEAAPTVRGAFHGTATVGNMPAGETPWSHMVATAGWTGQVLIQGQLGYNDWRDLATIFNSGTPNVTGTAIYTAFRFVVRPVTGTLHAIHSILGQGGLA